MKTYPEDPKVEPMKPTANMNPEIQTSYEYPELENRMALGGSTQVLDDFFEFTDYLTIRSRIKMKYRNSFQTITEDYYSGLLSF
jgi:hypothetical protein